MIIWLLAAGLGILVGGGVSREVRTFERLAAEDLAAQLQGPDKQVEVKVQVESVFDGSLARATLFARDFQIDALPLFAEPERPASGKLRTLEIRLSNFELAGLGFEELRADIHDCRYDLGLARRERKVRLSRSGVGPGYARLNVRAMERFILLKYREIQTVNVRLEKHKAFVEGRGTFGLFTSDFYVIATLSPRNGGEIWLDNAVVFLDGSRVRDGSERALLQAINPVIDQDRDLRLHGALEIQRIEIGDGFLEIFGLARIPDRPLG